MYQEQQTQCDMYRNELLATIYRNEWLATIYYSYNILQNHMSILTFFTIKH